MKQSDLTTAEGILFTDQYQLTMAQLYFRTGLHERQVQFDHFYRRYPDYGAHKAGYCINAGLESLVDWMQRVRFRERDLDLLRHQKGRVGNRMFDQDFLAWLGKSGNFQALTWRLSPPWRASATWSAPGSRSQLGLQAKTWQVGECSGVPGRAIDP